MTLAEMQRLWPLARVLHEARRDLAWGRGTPREPWPEWSTAYPHSPVAFVDLALAQAGAADRLVVEQVERAAAVVSALRSRANDNGQAVRGRDLTLEALREVGWFIAGQRHAAAELEGGVRALLPPVYDS